MSTHILQVDSSILGDQGQSSQLSSQLVAALQKRYPKVTVTHRDVTGDPVPHFTLETVQAIAAGKAELADRLIAEIQAADTIVLSAPMYNFAIPSTLKAWFDHIARAQVTFKYTENGPEGLLTGKKVYVITTRGGLHKDTKNDGVVPYLQTILGFVGLTDVEYIYAEGLSMGDKKVEALALAQADIEQAVIEQAV